MKRLLAPLTFTILVLGGCSDSSLVDSNDPGLQSEGLIAAQDVKPSVIPLPAGFKPEGIVAGRGTTFFVGSLGSGAIFQGDFITGEFITGEGSLLVPP